MRPSVVATIFAKEWREIVSNRLLLGVVAAPAVIFAALPTVIVAFIEVSEIDPARLGQIEVMLAAFPDLPIKLAAQGFIVSNFMAYFLLIPAMAPIAIASHSIIGERQTRSLEPQLATPIEVSELLAGKTLSAALPAILATWGVWAVYGLINAAIADPRLLRMIFSPEWIVAMATLVPLIAGLSVLLGVIVSSRVGDPRTAQQFGAFVVLPIIAIAVAQFLGGQATFTMSQVLVGDLVAISVIGILLVIGSWAFDREEILTRLG